MRNMIIAAIVTVLIVVGWLYYKHYPETSQKGCLHGKSEEEKIQFFKSLLSFRDADPVFFSQQFNDLLPHESRQFMAWQKAEDLISQRETEIKLIRAELSEALNDRSSIL